MNVRMTRPHTSATTLTRLGALIAPTLMLLASCAREPKQTSFTSNATAPTLGTAASFAVLAGSTATNTGPTVITGDLGVSPGTSITGFPPGTVLGTIHSADMQAGQAQADATAAYSTLASEACDVVYGVPTDLVGLTLVPGAYCFSSSGSLTGQLTLDAGGDPDAVWVFKTGSTLITGSNASVLVVNGGQACNVFWQVGSSATLGTGTSFVGTIIALTSITLNTNATLAGRALALNGAVTMDSNVITASACVPSNPVVIPPTLSKTFSPATIDAGDTSLLTITLSNADSTAAVLTAPLTDTLPSGVLIAGTPTTTCGGTASADATSVTLTGGSIPATGSCTLSVLVTGASGGTYINSIASGALQTSNGDNASPAIATLTVLQAAIAPTVGKAFSPATIAAGGTSLLTITLNNADATAATMTAPLTDTLPTGVLIAGTPSTTCGGTVTAGTASVTLAGGSIPAGGSCTITVLVTAASGGNFINTIASGALQTTNGNNAAPAVATLTVPPTATPPTLSKDFSPATIDAGGTSLLTITLSNGDSTAATITAPFTDNLPSGVLIAGTPLTTCGGAVTATTTSVTQTGGTIPANGSCTVTVLVSAANGGSYINSLAAGALQTSNGNNAAPAIATLTVSTPGAAPTLGKSFSPSTINAGDTSTLTITLSNPNPSIATLTAPLTDTLPSGMTVSGTPATTCTGVVTSNASSVTLTGGGIPANGSCTITVIVTVPSGGSYINNLAVGALQTSNGNNTAPATATLTVVTPGVIPPTLGKAFSPSTIAAGGTSTLTITLSNSNATVAILTAPLTDTLPIGMTVSGTPATTCGGTVSANSSSVTLTNGVIPANGSCTITVNVTVAAGGNYINSLAAGALQTNVGNNTTPAIATLTVTTPSEVTCSKTFSPATITAGGKSIVTITLINTGTLDAHLTAPFIDTLPSGVYIAGYATTSCGGTVTAHHGGSTITLMGGTIPASGSCTVTVKVTAPVAGSYFNTIPAGAVQTDHGSNASPVVVTLTVLPKTTVPVLEKCFNPPVICLGEVSTLTITLTNSDATIAHLTAPLIDHLPDDMTVAGGATTTCGGTPVAVLGGADVTLTNGTIPAHGSCTVTVDVTTACEGTYCNTINVCALQTDHGSNAGPAEATLTVNAASYPAP